MQVINKVSDNSFKSKSWFFTSHSTARVILAISIATSGSRTYTEVTAYDLDLYSQRFLELHLCLRKILCKEFPYSHNKMLFTKQFLAKNNS